MYWASIDKPAVEMSSLDGTGRVTLLNESNADYTGITLYNNCLYISDKSRRSVFYSVLAAVIITRTPNTLSITLHTVVEVHRAGWILTLGLNATKTSI